MFHDFNSSAVYFFGILTPALASGKWHSAPIASIRKVSDNKLTIVQENVKFNWKRFNDFIY